MDFTCIVPEVWTRDTEIRGLWMMKILVANGGEPRNNSEVYGTAVLARSEAASSRSLVFRTKPCRTPDE
jgi:hypothetical protein